MFDCAVNDDIKLLSISFSLYDGVFFLQIAIFFKTEFKTATKIVFNLLTYQYFYFFSRGGGGSFASVYIIYIVMAFFFHDLYICLLYLLK